MGIHQKIFNRTGLGVLCALCLLPVRAVLGQLPLPPELERPRDGDMIAWIGDTFVEREPAYAYLETWLTTRFPNRSFNMRNLGWSADTVRCESRGRFGTPKDGFEHLMNTLAVVKPSIVVIQYGTNDSQAGAAGLNQFLVDYKFMIAEIRKRFNPRRIILSTPVPPLSLNLPKTSPQRQKDLAIYSEAIQKLAKEVQADLLDISGLAQKLPLSDALAREKISDNGINFSNVGYWQLVHHADQQTGASGASSTLKFRLVQGRDPAVIVPASQSAIAFEFQMEPTASTATFEIRRVQLPAPVGPKAMGDDRPGAAPGWSFQFPGLKDGKYRLELDGKQAAVASAKAWSEGIAIGEDPDSARVEQIRQLIKRKNELFFHRWRPQNETYLLGFRKHEQGNNAVEIPQFDPLISKIESEIDRLKKPPVHNVTLVREVQP
ncbi:MAG: GDSL-type esterase/lipase family protein [Planctomycetota bacterium]|nr:GDSL-type esterase/lipase family protein [Planctomycetota bacterium]